MSFAERAKNRPRKKSGCAIARVLRQITDDKERAALQGMLDDTDTWPHQGEGSVEEALKAEGFDWVPGLTIGRHRRGQCECSKADML